MTLTQSVVLFTLGVALISAALSLPRTIRAVRLYRASRTPEVRDALRGYIGMKISQDATHAFWLFILFFSRITGSRISELPYALIVAAAIYLGISLWTLRSQRGMLATLIGRE
jgi:hypothetical protein